MATDVGRNRAGVTARRPQSDRLTTETKASFKTTELVAYVVVLIGLFVAGAVVDQADNGGLGARQVWLYAVILTVGYMISRGLAKSGSRDPYWSERGDRDAGH